MTEKSSRNAIRDALHKKTAETETAPCNSVATKVSPCRQEDKAYSMIFSTFSTIKRNTARRNVCNITRSFKNHRARWRRGREATTLRNSKLMRYNPVVPTLQKTTHIVVRCNTETTIHRGIQNAENTDTFNNSSKTSST